MSHANPRPARRGGINGYIAPWTKSENEALTRLYPTALRATVEAALPGRSWMAMAQQAGVLDIKRRHYWNAPRLQVLRDHYPTQGAAYVAQLLGCDAAKVTKQASLQGIERVFAAKPIPTPKKPRAVKPQPAPKPLPKPVPEPVPQHQPARLSNLINQKAAKKRQAAATGREVSVAYIRSLPYQHPEAHQYRMGGERAVLAYRQQQLAPAA